MGNCSWGMGNWELGIEEPPPCPPKGGIVHGELFMGNWELVTNNQ
jgi:hypothetical protein